MKCCLCDLELTMTKIPYTSSCGLSMCSDCVWVQVSSFGLIHCPVCQGNCQYIKDEIILSEVNKLCRCYFHKENTMKKFCDSCKLGYCEQCKSHKKCKGKQGEFRQMFSEALLK